MSAGWGEGRRARKGRLCISRRNRCCPTPTHDCYVEKKKKKIPFPFILFGHTCGIWKFLGQGSNSNCSCEVHHSCRILNPLCHSRNSKKILFSFSFFMAALVAYGCSRLGVELELQQQAYATATAMSYLSCLCNQCCSLWQCWIRNPLSKGRD